MFEFRLPLLMAMTVIGLSVSTTYADENEKENLAAVAKMMPTAKVTLQQALTAAEQKGRPLSGKFEVDEGNFQLSVYTSQGGKYSENVVDYHSGVITKSEPITGGDDLKEAKEQSEAMSKAKKSLKSAVDHAEGSLAGYRAVSVEPELKNGKSVAEVRLLKGTETKTTYEPLE